MEPIKKDIFTTGVEIVRSAEEDKPSRTIRGKAIVFNTPTTLWEDDSVVVREVISPDAVPESLLHDSDILMTMFHNSEILLARSKKGKGTLKYSRTEEGVFFEFDAPNTADGDRALELVRTGVIDGCSFWAYAYNEAIERNVSTEGKRRVITRTVKAFDTIRDMTLTPKPQYTETSVSVQRELSELTDPKGEQESLMRELEKKWAEVEDIAGPQL